MSGKRHLLFEDLFLANNLFFVVLHLNFLRVSEVEFLADPFPLAKQVLTGKMEKLENDLRDILQVLEVFIIVFCRLAVALPYNLNVLACFRV